MIFLVLIPQLLFCQEQNQPTVSLLSKLINIETGTRIQGSSNLPNENKEQLTGIKESIDSNRAALNTLNETIEKKTFNFSPYTNSSINIPEQITIKTATSSHENIKEIFESTYKNQIQN